MAMVTARKNALHCTALQPISCSPWPSSSASSSPPAITIPRARAIALPARTLTHPSSHDASSYEPRHERAHDVDWKREARRGCTLHRIPLQASVAAAVAVVRAVILSSHHCHHHCALRRLQGRRGEGKGSSSSSAAAAAAAGQGRRRTSPALISRLRTISCCLLPSFTAAIVDCYQSVILPHPASTHAYLFSRGQTETEASHQEIHPHCLAWLTCIGRSKGSQERKGTYVRARRADRERLLVYVRVCTFDCKQRKQRRRKQPFALQNIYLTSRSAMGLSCASAKGCMKKQAEFRNRIDICMYVCMYVCAFKVCKSTYVRVRER